MNFSRINFEAIFLARKNKNYIKLSVRCLGPIPTCEKKWKLIFGYVTDLIIIYKKKCRIMTFISFAFPVSLLVYLKVRYCKGKKF